VGGVEDDVFDGVDGLVFGEVHGGDLETVEEEAGAAGVECVGGDALEDFADGVLDGGAVFGDGEGEGPAAAAGFEVDDGLAVGVVVVAEGLEAEAGGVATATVGEDVAALQWGGFGHGWPPPWGLFRVKSESPADGRAFCSSDLILSRLSRG
jgi:hypothetical protein